MILGRGGGTVGTTRHLPCRPQPVGTSQNPESIAQGNNLGALTPLLWDAQVSQVSANIFSAQGNSQSLWVYTWGSPAAGGTPNRPPCRTSLEPKEHHLAVKKTCRGRAAPGWVQMSACTRTFQAEFNFLLLTQGPGEQQLPQTAPKMHINRGIIPYYKGMHA